MSDTGLIVAAAVELRKMQQVEGWDFSARPALVELMEVGERRIRLAASRKPKVRTELPGQMDIFMALDELEIVE